VLINAQLRRYRREQVTAKTGCETFKDGSWG
jgi:hypothetical protein